MHEFYYSDKDTIDSLKRMHSLYLEALRQREQDIIRFLAILAPALAGFFYLLLRKWAMTDTTFLVGILGIQGILFIGACYTAAIGFNYRSLILQIVKIEKHLGVKPVILKGWPREFCLIREKFKFFRSNEFIIRKRIIIKPNPSWCWPPEILKTFLWSFVLAIAFVFITSTFYIGIFIRFLVSLFFLLSGFMLLGYILHSYGKKLKNFCDTEITNNTSEEHIDFSDWLY